ncbi:MAG: PAS domain S-box protein [Planctomycetota bacterium]|nr:PAS domain S-box protein [Planctomycetota bacterium]
MAAIPTLLIGHLASEKLARQVDQRVRSSGMQLADLASILIQQHFESTTNFLQGYAGRYNFREAVKRRDFDSIHKHLVQAQEINKDLAFVNLFDKDGTLRSSTPELPQFYGKSFAGREWYQGVSHGWKPYVSDVFQTLVEPHKLVVAVAVPIVSEEGEVLGILTAAHTVETISRWMRRVQAEGQWTITIADRHARRAAHPDQEVLAQASDLSAYEAAARGARGERGSGDFEFHGHRLVAAYAPIPRFGWSAVVDQPRRLLEDDLDAVMRQVWLLAAVTIALAALASAFLAVLLRRMIEADRFFHLSSEMLCVADMKGLFVRLNDAMSRTLGYETRELLEKPFLSFVHPEDAASTAAATAQLAAGNPVNGFENRYRCKDGSYRWFLWSAIPDRARGEIIAVARDITERREAEERLRDLNQALEAQSARLTAVNQELESFAYSVSHDLRAPLRGIAGFSLALQEDCAGQLGETARGYLERIRTASKRMGSLIDDLLNLSRVTRREMRRERVNLSALAQEIVKDLKAAEPARVVEFVCQPDLWTWGDPQLLRIALENLLGNAWKFTARHATARLELSGQIGTEGVMEYTVKDDGAGFDMTYAGKLFGAFQRLHMEADFPGTGIGLATVHRVVHRHGGKIWATGAVEQGAAFHFTLGQEQS